MLPEFVLGLAGIVLLIRQRVVERRRRRRMVGRLAPVRYTPDGVLNRRVK